jgi:drug/metabolite transporter (DMT)-like permease
MSMRVWSWLLLLALLWGGSFFFAKVALRELPPFTIVWIRVTLAALALNLTLIATSRGLFRRGTPWRDFFAMGFLNNVLPFSLIVWGQTQIASGLASILNATTPLFTLLVAHFLTHDEKVNSARVVALLIGLAGVALLVGPGALSSATGNLWGEIACLLAALSYAFAGIFGRRFRANGIAPLEAATGQTTASALWLLPIVVAFDEPWSLAVPSLAVFAALTAIALLSTALGYILYFRILEAAGATNLLLVTFLMPLITILMGSAFLDERLDTRQFAGMALLGAGLALVDGRLAAALRPAK